ncbi:hypothetical protein BDV98DRAFT_562532 [Pterulicium gracile]|uniref:Uncharacterized protein n=1 Tax=Pterulicium gracile TaxID=1884261 RepID=A0A5C3QRV0_9AGAR|nr:hypothetical protein BDV98DRAFT_562532 [Pterula gracilis]
MQRLHDAKETARKAVSSSISSVQALEEDLKRLKARHDETTKVTLRDVQKELDDLTVFKDSIWDKMSDIDVMLDENGHFMKGIEAKALIQELRDEAERSHQANEYLRNRLLSVGTDLCHAQERVYDLEAQSIDESKARQVSTENLAVYASKLDQLTLRLEKRDRELLEAVQKSSGLQQQVEATQVRVKQLEQEIDKREGQLVEFRELQERSQELSDALAASEELVKSLTEELAQTKHDLEAASTKNDQQSETCTSLDRKVISLQEAYDMMTSQLSSQRAQAQEDLSKAALNLSAKEQDLLKAVQEVSALKVQERDLTKQLEDAQKSNDRLVKEAAKKEDEYTQLDKQLSILTERFQDQSISLRLVKDQHGNIQERLVSCEAAHAAELKSTQVSLQRDNDALRTELEHDKQVLREQLDVAQAERDTLTAQMDDHKRRQESQDTIHASLQTRVAVLEGERDLLRASAETLRLDSETLRRDSADALRRCTGDFEARLTAQEVVNAEALRRGVEDFEKRLRSQEISSAEALRRCAEDFEKRLSSQELSSTEALRRCTEDFEGREAAQAASYEARYAQQEATYTEHIKERVDACERINTAAIEAVEAKHNLNLTLIKRDLAAAQTELELHATRNKERDDSHSKSLAAETIKYELAQENATHLSRQLDDLQQRLSFLDNANAQLTREVEGSLPQGQEGAELSSLRSRIAALEAENELLRRKGSTLQSRYDAGTLEPHEQQFASSVMRGVRASHEAEMVKKSNEILRRDRQITALEADVASLTASLIGKLGQESKDGSLSEGVVNVSNEPTRVSVNDSTVRNTTISSMTAFSEVGTVAMEVKESTVQAVSLGGRFSQLGLEGSDSVMSEPPSSDDQPLADAYGSDSVDPRPTKRHRPHSPSAALEGLASTARRGRNTQSGKTRQTVVSRMKPDPQRAKDTESAAGVETEKATPKPLARKNAGKIRKRNG